MAVAAFFDVDGTLIAGNSAPLYMRHLRRTGQARRRDVLRALYLLVRYKFGRLDLEAVAGQSMRFVRGKLEAAVDADTLSWFEREVRPNVYPQMAAVVDAHRRAGHLPVIVTSASRYLAAPLAAELGIRHFLATELVVRDGAFTGEAVRPLCYGTGKVHWVRLLAEREGVDLGRSYFYTDSITDLPLLEAVGHPRVVHPDPPLRRLSRRRGWPVLWPRLGEKSALPLAVVEAER